MRFAPRRDRFGGWPLAPVFGMVYTFSRLQNECAGQRGHKMSDTGLQKIAFLVLVVLIFYVAASGGA